jgi:hypothetical protein
MPIESEYYFDKVLMEDLIAGLTKRYSKRRVGVHVSTLAMCPRQDVFKERDNPALTSREINFFSAGAASGGAIQSLADDEFNGYYNKNNKSSNSEKKYFAEYFTSIGGFIQGHIDLWHKPTNTPIEFKSSRVTKEDKLPKSFHVDQLKSYMVGMDSPHGILLYQLINKFEGEPFVKFVFHMSKAEREKMALAKIEDGIALIKAKAYKKPELARHVRYDTGNFDWLCKDCPWRQECDDINAKEIALRLKK